MKLLSNLVKEKSYFTESLKVLVAVIITLLLFLNRTKRWRVRPVSYMLLQRQHMKPVSIVGQALGEKV